MFQFSSTYRNYFIVILTILFFVPCTIKRDIKQHFAQEIFQNSQQTHAKTVSNDTCTATQTSIKFQKQDVSIKTLPSSTEVKTFSIPGAPLAINDVHWDEFTHHIEKIPTHIRLQLYLI